MKQDELTVDMTAKGIANRLALRLADRYPMGSVSVDATADGKQIKVTLVDSDGDSHTESFDAEKLNLSPDPLLDVLPRLMTPDDIAKGKIIREPTDEAAARAVATETDMPEDVIVTKPEAENIGNPEDVTIGTAEALTPKVNGIPVVVTEPNNAETADPETARAAAIKQAQDRAELAGARKVVINGNPAEAVPEAADANARAEAVSHANAGKGDVSLSDFDTTANADASSAEANAADAADNGAVKQAVVTDADAAKATVDSKEAEEIEARTRTRTKPATETAKKSGDK